MRTYLMAALFAGALGAGSAPGCGSEPPPEDEDGGIVFDREAGVVDADGAGSEGGDGDGGVLGPCQGTPEEVHLCIINSESTSGFDWNKKDPTPYDSCKF